MQWNIVSQVSPSQYLHNSASIPTFFSYDTEALNKQLIQTEADERLFVNTFGDTNHKKVTLGVQQLYIIGTVLTFYSYNIKQIIFSLFLQDFMMLFPSVKP